MYIIFSDVDGTMVDGNQALMVSTAQNIKEAKAKGIMLAICTGNSHFENMQALALKINADFLITSDGARVFDVKENKVIYKSLINKQIANNFLTKVYKLAGAAFLSWVTEKEFSINVINDKYYDFAISINKQYHLKSGNFSFTDAVNDDIYRMSVSGRKEFIDKVKEIALNQGFDILRIHDLFLTISLKKSSKGNAAENLIKIKNIDIANVMTIGDGKNDISMLSIVKNSYAMANASSSVKKAANRHTSSVEQNGLGEAIIDFMFRKKI